MDKNVATKLEGGGGRTTKKEPLFFATSLINPDYKPSETSGAEHRSGAGGPRQASALRRTITAVSILCGTF